jgi:hypothetical protein
LLIVIFLSLLEPLLVAIMSLIRLLFSAVPLLLIAAVSARKIERKQALGSFRRTRENTVA